METVPAFSWTVCAALANAAVGNAGGGASEAATVRVCVVVAPSVAPVGVPNVTIIVSAGSARPSSVSAMAIVPEVCPAGIVSGEAGIW